MSSGNWFGLHARAAVLEFPVYSILTFLGGRVFGLLTAGRLLSLLCSIGAVFLFDRMLAEQGHPRRRTATVLFALAPAAIFYGHAVQPDALLLLLTLLAAYAFLRSGTTLAGAAVATAALGGAAMIKPTALIVLTPALLYLGLTRNRLPVALTAVAIATAAALAWGAYDRSLLLASAPDWYRVNTATAWLFGTARERVSPFLYETLIQRAGLILLPPLTVGLIIRTAGDRVGNPFWWWWLAGGLASIAVFTHLNVVHFYYQLLLIPALAALAATSAPAWPARTLLQVGAGATLVALSAVGCRDLYRADQIYYDAGSALAAVTDARHPALALSNAGTTQSWFPAILYYSGHDGWNLPLAATADDINGLPGPPPCQLVEVFDGQSRADVPRGWRLDRRTSEYALAHRSDAPCV
jgi:4-amino-4-deoxy-L-arabinose transferase-like glycosyltransferase